MAGSNPHLMGEELGSSAAVPFQLEESHLAPTTAYQGRGSQKRLLALLRELDLKSLEEVEHLEAHYRGGPRPARDKKALRKVLSEYRAGAQNAAELETSVANLKAADTGQEDSPSASTSQGEQVSLAALEKKVVALQETVTELKKSLQYLTQKVAGSHLAYPYGATWVVAEPGRLGADSTDEGLQK